MSDGLPKPDYERGNVKLFNADSLALLPMLPAGCVDAVVTDPPYFQPAAHYCGTRSEGRPRRSISDTSILENFFRLFIAGASRALKPTGTWYLFCDGQSYPIAFTGMYPHCKYVRPLIWDRLIAFNGYTWRHQHEIIAWGEQEDTPRIPTGDGDVIRLRGVLQDDREHPAEKPVELVGLLLEKTLAGGTVLDPFMGSGTTGVACIQTGRPFVGVELEKRYFDIACRRIDQAFDDFALFEKTAPAVRQGDLFAISDGKAEK
jgi:site-specific DNA-methyltransferase (adenine-specific)